MHSSRVARRKRSTYSRPKNSVMQTAAKIKDAGGRKKQQFLANLGASIAGVRLEKWQAGGNTELNGEPAGRPDAPLCDEQCNTHSHIAGKLASVASERQDVPLDVDRRTQMSNSPNRCIVDRAQRLLEML